MSGRLTQRKARVETREKPVLSERKAFASAAVLAAGLCLLPLTSRGEQASPATVQGSDSPQVVQCSRIDINTGKGRKVYASISKAINDNSTEIMRKVGSTKKLVRVDVHLLVDAEGDVTPISASARTKSAKVPDSVSVLGILGPELGGYHMDPPSSKSSCRYSIRRIIPKRIISDPPVIVVSSSDGCSSAFKAPYSRMGARITQHVKAHSGTIRAAFGGEAGDVNIKASVQVNAHGTPISLSLSASSASGKTLGSRELLSALEFNLRDIRDITFPAPTSGCDVFVSTVIR
jgi:hypothetical protein